MPLPTPSTFHQRIFHFPKIPSTESNGHRRLLPSASISPIRETSARVTCRPCGLRVGRLTVWKYHLQSSAHANQTWTAISSYPSSAKVSEQCHPFASRESFLLLDGIQRERGTTRRHVYKPSQGAFRPHHAMAITKQGIERTTKTEIQAGTYTRLVQRLHDCSLPGEQQGIGAENRRKRAAEALDSSQRSDISQQTFVPDAQPGRADKCLQ